MLLKRLGSVSAPFAKRAILVNTPRAAVDPLRFAHHEVPALLRPPVMDEISVPCGCWKEHYENEQRKYNIQLICGFGFFLISFIAVIGSGEIDFNCLYPPPAPRESMMKT